LIEKEKKIARILTEVLSQTLRVRKEGERHGRPRAGALFIAETKTGLSENDVIKGPSLRGGDVTWGPVPEL